MSPDPDPKPSPPESSTLSRPAFWVAVAVLVAFGVFTLWMTTKIDLGETSWARLTYLYQGVEAVVFAAAGAIFGTVVQRQNVKEAKDREDAAQAEADKNSSEAEAGRAVQAAIQAMQGSDAPDDVPPPVSDRIGANELPRATNASTLAYLSRVYDQALRDS